MSEEIDDQRARMIDILLQKVAEDPYPSTSMMDMLEGLLEPDDVPAYAAVLLQKIEDENFPSVPMMQRLLTLTNPD